MAKKFKYAPGVPGYGTIGTDGSNGLTGMSVYFCEYSGDTDRTIIETKISNNEILSEGAEKIPGFPTRNYQNGDMLIDVNGKSFGLINIGDSLSLQKYEYTGSRLNTSTIFIEGPDTINSDVEYTRYSNSFGIDNFLVDSVYTSKQNIGNYTASPSQSNGIYGIGAVDFAKVNYTDNSIGTDDYHPFEVFTNTTSTTNPEKSIALVKSNTDNHWRLGNFDTGSGDVRDVSLSLDFKKINVGDIYSSGKIYGTIDGKVEVENLNLPGYLTVQGKTTLNDIDISGDVSGNIIPDADSTYDIGSWTTKYENIYADKFHGKLAAFDIIDILGVWHGGTGKSSFVPNGILYASEQDVIDTSTKLTYNGSELNVDGNIVPSTNGTKDLGTSSNKWDNIWCNDLVFSSTQEINGTSNGDFIKYDIYSENNINLSDYKFKTSYVFGGYEEIALNIGNGGKGAAHVIGTPVSGSIHSYVIQAALSDYISPETTITSDELVPGSKEVIGIKVSGFFVRANSSSTFQAEANIDFRDNNIPNGTTQVLATRDPYSCGFFVGSTGGLTLYLRSLEPSGGAWQELSMTVTIHVIFKGTE